MISSCIIAHNQTPLWLAVPVLTESMFSAQTALKTNNKQSNSPPSSSGSLLLLFCAHFALAAPLEMEV